MDLQQAAKLLHRCNRLLIITFIALILNTVVMLWPLIFVTDSTKSKYQGRIGNTVVDFPEEISQSNGHDLSYRYVRSYPYDTLFIEFDSTLFVPAQHHY